MARSGALSLAGQDWDWSAGLRLVCRVGTGPQGWDRAPSHQVCSVFLALWSSGEQTVRFIVQLFEKHVSGVLLS